MVKLKNIDFLVELSSLLNHTLSYIELSFLNIGGHPLILFLKLPKNLVVNNLHYWSILREDDFGLLQL